ncbi:MAG: PadR family transcriptional regulator [Actinomycetota bacterium]|nr:PadR family transcriptional regulator [Actinomycetota bacterium]
MAMSRGALSPTSYVVLGLLASAGEATPYELERLVDISVGHFWSFPHSQLYSEPPRLVGRGLLEEQREQTGRRRRVFRLTEAGREALQGWLAEAVGSTTEIRDLGLLKLFFGSSAAAAGDVRASAAAQVAAHEERLATFRDLAGHDMDRHVQATLRLGIAYEEAAVAFWRSVEDLNPEKQL